MQAVGLNHVQDRTNDSLVSSLAPVEYAYYFTIFYTVLGAPLGLILTGGIGTGFLLIPILALCFVALGSSVLTVLQTAWIPLACGASFLFIQLALHGESLHATYVYPFGPWLLSLVIVQALAMHRPNFLHRFAWFTLFMGLAMLPFMTLSTIGGYEKMGLNRDVGYSNPNALAAWIGFCMLYLTIKGYVETRLAYRLAAWLMAAGSLYIVTMTVSRGALIALAGSQLVASRRLLKVGFLPIFLLGGLVVGLMEFGLFDQALRAYTLRGEEETGRLRVWPLLIEQFLNSPVIGVGASHAGAEISTGKFVTPHNSFLLFAVASGAMPLILFCAYLFRSGMAALRTNMSEQQDAAFHLPLVVYALLITCAGNLEFMTPWAVVSLAVPFAASVSRMNR
jgi:O-Antigen ligase